MHEPQKRKEAKCKAEALFSFQTFFRKNPLEHTGNNEENRQQNGPLSTKEYDKFLKCDPEHSRLALQNQKQQNADSDIHHSPNGTNRRGFEPK